MEMYFEGQGVVEETIKVRTATLYLSDNATLWWRRKCVDMEKGTCNIATWKDFKRELKRQFFPENVVYEARKKLRELKHKSTISDYILRENNLYVKKEKCSFARDKVHFLGHIIKDETLYMDQENVKAIKEWKPPNKVSELRSFLGLDNYYRRIIKGYSTKAAPLTDLLKKNHSWEWSKECQKAFDELKAAITEGPVLALPDYSKVFEVHTDAFDYAIGGVLMQEGHPIAFESRKLNDIERR
ncbi:uncharacterized protein [Arachis hypogaea]|uniref:uncharacterized protein n=1 Tax=Arachis hypogaea TaxID=3818 RepID=UPI000DED23A2|nr:uncharacterized protein LOC112721997 [Arachis hypogaea]